MGKKYTIYDLAAEIGVTPSMVSRAFSPKARIAGWSAHRIEEIQNAGKIIRPAYINVKEYEPYIKLEDR